MNTFMMPDFSRQVTSVSNLPSVIMTSWPAGVAAQGVNEIINVLQRALPYNRGTHMYVDFAVQSVRHLATHYVLMEGLRP